MPGADTRSLPRGCSIRALSR